MFTHQNYFVSFRQQNYLVTSWFGLKNRTFHNVKHVLERAFWKKILRKGKLLPCGHLSVLYECECGSGSRLGGTFAGLCRHYEAQNTSISGNNVKEFHFQNLYPEFPNAF